MFQITSLRKFHLSINRSEIPKDVEEKNSVLIFSFFCTFTSVGCNYLSTGTLSKKEGGPITYLFLFFQEEDIPGQKGAHLAIV